MTIVAQLTLWLSYFYWYAIATFCLLWHFCCILLRFARKWVPSSFFCFAEFTNCLSVKHRNAPRTERIKELSTFERNSFRVKYKLLSGIRMCSPSNTAYLLASSERPELGVIAETPEEKSSAVSFIKPCNKDESTNDETAFDSRDGYLADTEIDDVTSTSETRDSCRQLSGKHCSLSSQEEQTIKCSNSIAPYQLPAQERFLGLHRILIGCRLSGVLHLTYALMIAVICIIALQVYEMFAPIGVRASLKLRVTWPWLLFQTLCR